MADQALHPRIIKALLRLRLPPNDTLGGNPLVELVVTLFAAEGDQEDEVAPDVQGFR